MLGKLITSKTRLRLLIKFFVSQANSGYLNGLASEMGESTNGIRKELNHLYDAGYIEKERKNADKLKRLENIRIPDQFNFDVLASLSHEAKEKLNKLRPQTLAQASRISGINPSDISVLLVSMGR